MVSRNRAKENQVEYGTGMSPDEYLGIQRMTVDGVEVPTHVWSCGLTMPVIAGGDGDGSGGDGGQGGAGTGAGGNGTGSGSGSGDGGQGGSGGDGGQGGDDDDDDIDLDDPDAIKAIKDPKRREAAKQAAKYRVRANERTKERDEAVKRATDLDAKVKDLEQKLKDGSSDSELKGRVTTLEAEVTRLTGERDALQKKVEDSQGKLQKVAVSRQVADAVTELKIEESADFVMFLLDTSGQLSVDDEGDVEDLSRNLKKLIKAGKLKVVSDDGEGSSGGGGGNASGSSSSSKGHNGPKGSGGLDRAALEAKFPALRGRAS
jgi:hypothetical protein